jgi:hypothetical protein
MRDSLDDLEMDLGQLPEIRSVENPSTPSAAQQVRRALRGKHVCPFCGTQRETDVGACLHCSLEDTPTTRTATRSKLGPWYVLQSRNPSAPGMNFATLMVLVQKGRVTARSVLRGPTTGQFWRHAAKVKGVSREFGLCWNCGGDVAKNARACASCKRLQEPPLNPDVLLEGAEFCGEELAEAMWSDETPNSSQMSASSQQAQPRARPHVSPVDRLAARGGVRREVAPQYPPPQQVQPQPRAEIASMAPAASRAQGAMAMDGIEGLPAHGLEMAVFQRSNGTYGGRGGGGMIAKILKVIFVAVLLSAAGVVAMCSFDEGFRKKVIDIGQQLKSRVSTANGNVPTSAAPEVETERLPAEKAKARAWELWKVGVEEERRGEFAAAVKTWEKIKALSVPEDDLPLSLDARIATAKKRAK